MEPIVDARISVWAPHGGERTGSVAATPARCVASPSSGAHGLHARFGGAVTAADTTCLQGPSLDATTGVTFAGAGVTPAGDWAPQPPFALATSGNVVTASAVIVHAR